MRVIGAGLGRTGTLSLKHGLERLLGGKCYHMVEVFPRPDHVQAWRRAAEGDPPDWPSLFDGFVATVDWPSGSWWRELSEVWPDALILLSTRSPASWWKSASSTIFQPPDEGRPQAPEFRGMVDAMLTRRFTPDFRDEAAATAAFERHVAEVRATAPKERLLEWTASDGWGPLCAALGVPVPDEPFPHVNSTEEFRARRVAPRVDVTS